VGPDPQGYQNFLGFGNPDLELEVLDPDPEMDFKPNKFFKMSIF
jgi:hypothetical protein